MATKTFYLLNSTAVTPNFFGNLQDGGTAPAAAASAFGWAVKTTATSTPYWRARLGANATATTVAATSYIASATGPTPGTGATNTTAGDSFVSPTPYTGTFAAGNWTLAFGVRTGAATSAGAMRCRVWASVNSSGASARELTSGPLVGTTVTMSSTTTTYTSSITWNAPAITLNNEYLFFQLEWQETTAGTSNSCSVLFYQSAATVTTTNWAPIDDLAGNLAPTVALAGDTTVTTNGLSLWGKGSYGVALYSRVLAPAGQTQDLAGNLAPTVAFAAPLSITEGLAGNLTPAVAFSASAAVSKAFAGGIAPTVAFGGSLTFSEVLAGGIAPTVVFSANLDVAFQALSGNLAPNIVFSGTLDLAGQVTFGTANLAPSVALSARLTALEVLAGNLAPTVTFSGALTTLTQAALAGGLTPSVAFGASLSATEALAGNLKPSVAFSGLLSSVEQIAGGLAPTVAFSGSASILRPLAGNLAPTVAFSGTLDFAPKVDVQGGLAVTVALAGDVLISQPLWGASEPPPPMWAESELCPDPGWIALTDPNGLVYQTSAYGLGGYGAHLYSKGGYVPAEPSPWVPSELCHG